MTGFTGSLKLEHLDADWRQWRLLEVLTWEFDRKGSGQRVDIPVGFIFDGASTPRWVWTFLPPTGSYMRAAGLHDYLLFLLAQNTPNEFFTKRKAADHEFLAAMLAVGVSKPVAYVMFWAVRLMSIWKGLTAKKRAQANAEAKAKGRRVTTEVKGDATRGQTVPVEVIGDTETKSNGS